MTTRCYDPFSSLLERILPMNLFSHLSDTLRAYGPYTNERQSRGQLAGKIPAAVVCSSKGAVRSSPHPAHPTRLAK